MIKKISIKIGINTKFETISETKFDKKTKKGDLILDICNFYNSTNYISPIGSYEYLKNQQTNFKNINIIFQNYKHPCYKQIDDEFIPYIGIFDMLFNIGFKNALNIIRSGRNYENM